MKHTNKLSAIIAISDTHVGSLIGLWPNDFETQSGNKISLNPYQLKMYNLWLDSTKRAIEEVKGRDFILLLNGDLVEGCGQHKSIQYMSPDPADESDAAYELLKPMTQLKNCKKVIVVKGTRCHCNGNEETIAKRLGAVKVPQHSKQQTFDKAIFQVGGCWIDATHHISTTSRVYLEAGRLSIHLGNARLNYAREGLTLPKVFIRSHAHTPCYFSDARGLIMILGAFQGLSSYGFNKVPDSIPYPAIGTMTFDGDGKLPVAKLHGAPLLQNEYQII